MPFHHPLNFWINAASLNAIRNTKLSPKTKDRSKSKSNSSSINSDQQAVKPTENQILVSDAEHEEEEEELDDSSRFGTYLDDLNITDDSDIKPSSALLPPILLLSSTSEPSSSPYNSDDSQILDLAVKPKSTLSSAQMFEELLKNYGSQAAYAGSRSPSSLTSRTSGSSSLSCSSLPDSQSSPNVSVSLQRHELDSDSPGDTTDRRSALTLNDYGEDSAIPVNVIHDESKFLSAHSSKMPLSGQSPGFVNRSTSSPETMGKPSDFSAFTSNHRRPSQNLVWGHHHHRYPIKRLKTFEQGLDTIEEHEETIHPDTFGLFLNANPVNGSYQPSIRLRHSECLFDLFENEPPARPFRTKSSPSLSKLVASKTVSKRTNVQDDRGSNGSRLIRMLSRESIFSSIGRRKLRRPS